MGGPRSSTKWAARKAIPSIIRAKDLLKLHALGEGAIDAFVLGACELATNAPTQLTGAQRRAIAGCWFRFAEEGKLRGIRLKEVPK